MASEWLSLTGPFRFEQPDGGNVQIAAGSEVYALEKLPWPPGAVGLGPLTLGTQQGEPLWIETFVYEQGGRETPLSADTATATALPGLLIAGHQAGAAGDDTDGQAAVADEPVKRRDVLKVAGGLGAGLVFAGSAVAADDAESFDVARFNVAAPSGTAANPGGIELGVLDVVADVLPAGSEFTVFADGDVIDVFEPAAGETALVPSGLTGEMRVAVSDSLGLRDRLAASIAGLFGTRNTLSYQFALPDVAAELAADREIVLSRQSMVVGPAAEHAPDSSALTIGGESIAHRDERGSDRGVYFVRDEEGVSDAQELVYRVGDAAPESNAAEIRLDIGRIDEARDDVSRAF